jgi:two-component system response regulator FixJ
MTANEAVLVSVVDDDAAVRDALGILLRMSGYRVMAYESAVAFLKAEGEKQCDCLVADIRMPDMDGIELQQELNRRGNKIPVIIMTGHGDIPLAVRAMKAGAIDFLEKPFEEEAFLMSLRAALASREKGAAAGAEAETARARIAGLTPREKDVLDQLVDGHQNKMIAYNLSISPRTVEVYRGRVMEKMKARSVADLVRMALASRD